MGTIPGVVKIFEEAPSMRIQLLPVYSKLAKPGDVPDELIAPLPEGTQLSQHQVETYKQLVNRNVDVVINTAMTGDGKSLAAYLPTLTRPHHHAFAMYPTIELSRDQQRQFENYTSKFGGAIRSEALWGARLGELARERSAKRRGEILKERFDNCQVILTNPDIFNLVMNYRYGSNIFSDQELPYTLANNFDDMIFDEFHIFAMPQIVAAITAMLFFLEYLQGDAPRFLFSSATPDPTFLLMMKRAGIKVHEVRGMYSSDSGDDLRHILHPSSLSLHKLQEDENTELWLQKNLSIIIKHWQEASRKPKGAIILNSVVAARRIARMLDKQLRPYEIKIGEVTGLADNQQRHKAMREADLIIGTSTIDVGIDFNISLLIFETLDAGNFLQRLGRLGRVRQDEAPFDRYEAHALFSNRTPWIYDRFVQRLHEQGIGEGDSIDRPDTLRNVVIEQEVFQQATAFKAYAKRWGILQAAHVIATLEDKHREQGFETTALALRERYKAMFDLRDFDSAVRRYHALVSKKRPPQEQKQSSAILDEVLAFRGSSSFQAAVWDETVTPPTFIGYDTLALVQNIDFRVVDEVAYKEALEGQSDATKKEALEELLWAIKDKEEHPLVIKILQFFQEREQLVLGWEGIRLQDYTRQIVVLKGWIINEPRISRDLDRLNQFLRRLSLVCYCTAKDASDLRRSLRLPPHFPLYHVAQSGKSYTVAFGKAALLLEAEMLRWRGKDEENEAIFC
jgi:CRISPR-associated endonuclease/helicase Cas3